jgi:cytochrome P450
MAAKDSESRAELFKYGRDHVNDFDLDSKEFNQYHNEVMSELAACPFARSRVGKGYTIITSYDDVRRVAMDWQGFSNQHGFWPNRPPDMPWFQLIDSDPPFHTAWRKALSPYFSMKACEGLVPTIRAIVDANLDRVLPLGHTDFVKEIATPLPVQIFFREFLPLPEEDFDRVVGYASDGFVGPVEDRAAAWAKCSDYVDQYLRRRAQEPPRGDMIDAIVKGIDLEDVAQYVHGLTPDQVRTSIVTNLISGSIDNVVYVLASMCLYLAQHPVDQKRLARNPGLIPNAIEEAVRFFSPNPMIGRTCTTDTVVGGAELHKGDYVMLAWGAANRDKRAFDNPDTLDFTRQNANRQLGFGHGPHRCIGIHLARTQIRVALERILERLPDFEVSPGTHPSYACGLVHEMRDLQLSFSPTTALGRSGPARADV